MAASGAVEAFLDGLEAQIDSAVAGHREVALAFSGGLGSMLVAMVARKRCDLRCLVAGFESAPDVNAARMAKSHFDYRIEVVALDRTETRRLDADLRRNHPALASKERGQLIPLRAVLGSAGNRPILAGFSGPSFSPALEAVFLQDQVTSPLHAARGIRVPSRGILQGAAIALGLPETWARVKHRAPIIGAGVADFLRRTNPTMR